MLVFTTILGYTTPAPPTPQYMQGSESERAWVSAN